MVKKSALGAGGGADGADGAWGSVVFAASGTGAGTGIFFDGDKPAQEKKDSANKMTKVFLSNIFICKNNAKRSPLL